MNDEPTGEDFERLWLECLAEEAEGDPEAMLEYFGDNPDELMEFFTHLASASTATTTDRMAEHREDAARVYCEAAKAIAERNFQAERKESEEQAP